MHRTPANETLVVAFTGQVFGVQAATGTVQWEVKLRSSREVEIAIEDGVVIAATEDEIAFIDLASGHLHAKLPISGSYPRRPTVVVAGGHLYIGGGGEVTCMTTRGQRVWAQTFKGKGLGGVALGFHGNVRQADDRGDS